MQQIPFVTEKYSWTTVTPLTALLRLRLVTKCCPLRQEHALAVAEPVGTGRWPSVVWCQF